MYGLSFISKRPGIALRPDLNYFALRSLFKAGDWNQVTNTWISEPSAGDSGTRSNATNGTLNGATKVAHPSGQSIIRNNGTNGWWIRLQTLTENTGMYVPGTTDYIFTFYVNFTVQPNGTAGGSGLLSTRLTSDSSQGAGCYAWWNGSTVVVGSSHRLNSASAGTSLDYNVSGSISMNTPVILQYGLINRRSAIRFNLGPWQYSAQAPSDAVYPIAGQNFHIGYSPYGATYYFRGEMGNVVSTWGLKPMTDYDEIAYRFMVDYGI